MGFAPFGIGVLMGLLTLTAYACCAAVDKRNRNQAQRPKPLATRQRPLSGMRPSHTVG